MHSCIDSRERTQDGLKMYSHSVDDADPHIPMTMDEITAKLDVPGLRAKGHAVHVQACSCVHGTGLQEGMQWLVDTLALPDAGRHPASAEDAAAAAAVPPQLSAQEQLLQQWLQRQDSPDDDFLQRFNSYTLDTWDHYTHLRVAWLLLTRHGRQQAKGLIFSGIKAFIQNSPLTQRKDTSRGTTFHETMTYFWFHIVHFAIQQAQQPLTSQQLHDHVPLQLRLEAAAEAQNARDRSEKLLWEKIGDLRQEQERLEQQQRAYHNQHGAGAVPISDAARQLQRMQPQRQEWLDSDAGKRDAAIPKLIDDLLRELNGLRRSIQAVDSYATKLSPFKFFLLVNPFLADGGYFLQFYSRERMLLDPAARSQVICGCRFW